MVRAFRTAGGRKQSAAGLALLAMLVQILVSAWHAPLIPSGTMKTEGGVPMIAICTVDGITWIPVTAVFGDAAESFGFGSDGPEPSESHEPPPGPETVFCPICLSLALTILIAVASGLARLAPIRRYGRPWGGAFVVSPLSIHAPAARGPPVPA